MKDVKKRKGKNRKVIGISLLILILIVIGFYFFNGFQESIEAEGSFDVKDLFLKINLNPGVDSIYEVGIENINKRDNEFLIKVNGLEDFVFSDEKIIINYGEEGKVKLNIQIPEDSVAGVYVGSLVITLDGLLKRVPIILEVESEEILFDANIDLYPKGESLVKGRQLISEIKLFDLASIGVRDIELEYFVKDFDGRTLISETESKAIDGRLDYTKSFQVPENMELNEYVLGVVVKYQNSAGVSSVFFNVVDKNGNIFDSSDLSFMIILFSFFFVVFIIIFVYYIFYRDKLFGELQRQYKRELKKQKEILLEKEKCVYSKLKTSEEREVYRKEIGKIKKGRLSELGEMHKERVSELKKMKGKVKKKDIKNKLNEWKKKGYDTSVLEKK